MQMWFISNVACIEVYVTKNHLNTLDTKIVDEEIEDFVDLSKLGVSTIGDRPKLTLPKHLT